MSDSKSKLRASASSTFRNQSRIPASPSIHNHQWLARVIIIVLLDAILISASYFLALMLRFDFAFSTIDARYVSGYLQLLPLYVIVAILIMWIFRLYHSIWSYVSVTELARLLAAWATDQVAVALIYAITRIRMPVSFWVIGAILCFLSTSALRFSYRFSRSMRNVWSQRSSGDASERRVMIIGAGDAGRMLVREILSSAQLNYKVCCIIDDNPQKRGLIVDGIPVVGNRGDIQRMVEKYHIDDIFFAIPSIPGIARKEILEVCRATGCNVRVVPGVYQLVDGQVSISRLRPIQLEDLLGRDPITVNNNDIHSSIRGKRILVTGGGGSIGSELCRQIARDQPEQLIIFDIYENNAYNIQQELRRYYPSLNLVTLIGSVRNTSRVNSIISTYKPEIIFHAAAHKHVPLMEDSPNEAIKNNVMGTYKVARAAAHYGVSRFVLISTDKAVNPTNIMGASKRLCEMVIQMMNRKAQASQLDVKTEFVAVRFGNVLGSNGSVIPLFESQIAAGGPVTVTDKRIIRYFMTIPEAVSLVLQAEYYAKGGEIFVLDMGEPVKIDDMARNLIRLSGYEPDVDIKVVYTGLRPGEKLYEEMLMGEEGLKETPNKLIHIGEPIEMDDDLFERQLHKLDALSRHEEPKIKQLVAEIVPTYKPEL